MSFTRIGITFVVLATSQAFASTMFVGNTVQFSHAIDNTGPVIDGDNQFRCGPTNYVVDNSVEVTNCDAFVSVDISHTNILVTFLITATPSSGFFFNGLHWFDVNDELHQILGLNVTPGAAASVVTFDDDNIYFDMQGVGWNQGETVSIDVTFAPEPSGAILLTAGIAAMLLLRRRRVQS